MTVLTKIERETVIRRSMADDMWDVFSDIPRDIRRIIATAKAFDCSWEIRRDGSVWATFPTRALTFRAHNGQRQDDDDLDDGDDASDD